MTTAALGRLSVELDLDSGTFNGNITRAGKTIRTFNSDLNRVPAATGGAERSVNNLGMTFSRFARQAAGMYAALVTARLVVSGFGKSVVTASAELERMTALLSGMSTAADDAGKLADAKQQLEQITQLARTTPFSIDAITNAWIKFKAGGLDPADGSLKSLLDSVAKFGGSSQQLERASVAIQQMAGKGIISMEELRQQLGEAIPTAATDMAKALGMSVAQMNKAIASGSVESKTALARFFAQLEISYGGSAQKIMDSFGGRVAVFRTNWTQMLREVGKSSGLFDTTKRALDQINQSFADRSVQQFAISVARGMGVMVDGIVRVVRAFAEYQRAIIVAGAALASFLVTTRILIPILRSLSAAALALSGASGIGALGRSLMTMNGIATLSAAAIGRLRIALAGLVTAGGIFTIAISALAALGTAWFLHKKRIDDATEALREHGVAYDDFVLREQEQRLATLKEQMARLQEGLSDPNLGGQEGMENPRMASAARKSMLVEVERTGRAITQLEDDLAKNRAAQAKRNGEARTEQDLAEIEKRQAELAALLGKPFELAAPEAAGGFVDEWEKYYAEIKAKTAQMKADVKSSALEGQSGSWFSDLTGGMLNDIQALSLNLVNNAQQRAQREIEIEQQKVATILQLNGATAEQIAAVQALISEKTRLMQENIAANSPVSQLLASWQDASQRMGEATAGWLQGASEGLAEFVTTGKFRFKDFANSIIKDLVRIATQKMIAGIVGSLLGGPAGAVAGTAAMALANGGVMDSRGLRKYANGGIANRPQLAVFGEGDKPEAFVPLPDGRTIPVTLSGKLSGATNDGQDAPPAITVNVFNQSGQQVAAEAGSITYDQIDGYILNVVVKNVSRVGSFRDSMKSALR